MREPLAMEYRSCPTCGGAMSDRIEYNSQDTIVSWLRYEYEGLNLLRIDERFDDDQDGIDDGDPWRPLNAYVHAPGQIGQIGQIVRGILYRHSDTGTTTHDMFYTYDALGNVAGVLVECDYYRFDMDAFGNPIGTVKWPSITSAGPKEHLTGKMYDEVTGLYYFHARWYDPEVGRDPLIPSVPAYTRAVPGPGGSPRSGPGPR